MSVVFVSAANVRAALHWEASCIMSAQFDWVETRGPETTLNWFAENATKIFTINWTPSMNPYRASALGF